MFDFSAPDTIWTLLGAALVFFMQAGFAMVEAGLTRAKNAGNIVMKNVMDYALGTLVYWFIGFSIMFGVSIAGFIGEANILLLSGSPMEMPANIPPAAYLIFQTVFCATSATIVSGAMAERTKFSSYCLYSLLISAFIYPISGHWIWGGGWLAQMGFHDFAGSCAVHMVGGVAALVGAAVLGARIGKYDRNGKPKAILGHSITLAALGVFILWFAWFGFNGASTLGMEGQTQTASSVFVTTNIAAATATVAVMLITWARYKKPDVSMTLNGSLAGLVCITAGCDIVDNFGAFWIGLIAAFVVVLAVEFVDQKLRIDDPVGAIAVHGCCGAVGTLCVGLFAVEGGLFYSGDGSLLGIQALGVISVIGWVAVTMTCIFLAIRKTIGLRVTPQEELEGLDLHEHGLASGYADFMPATADGMALTLAQPGSVTEETAVPVKREAPVASQFAVPDGVKMSKVTIIANRNKFEALKDEMNHIGVTGMTVVNVMGCGIQKGNSGNFYRGVPLDIHLLPKVKVEIVVAKVPVDEVIDAARKALYTGNIGDGKIFVSDIENVVKIRTNEEGYAALQDV